MITVNLREIFTADSQSDLASKLNFNFNQLLALGFGEIGQSGAIGPSGPAGPIGPIGETGTAGSQIFSGASDPTSSDPVDAVLGDYYISSNKIHKKLSNASGSNWEVVSNFNTIFQNISSVGTSTWQLGSISGFPIATSKYLAPIKSYGNKDRVSVNGVAGEYLTNEPNWFDNASSITNSQVALYNFDPTTTKTYIQSSGSNSYAVTIRAGQLGIEGSEVASELAFPYTALLSLYSFYSASGSTAEATQFDDIDGSAIGNRHQIELGSVDPIAESLVSSDSTAKNVVSPTWQNLRIRKYRIAASNTVGGSVIHADFNLNSADSSTSPSLNSKFTWRINKKPNTNQGSGSTIEMSLSNQKAESESLSKLTGLGVDGLHLKSGNYNLGFGFDPANTGAVKNLLIDGGNTLDTAIFRNLGIRLASTSGTTGTASLSIGGLTSTRPIVIQTTGSGAAGTIQLNAGQSGRSIFILAPNAQGSVYLGTSSDSAGTGDNWGANSGFAIKTRGNRLAAGLPFPSGTSALPRANSSDSNVLDEYLEVSFTPEVGFDTTIPFTAPASSITSDNLTGPKFENPQGRFIKIGKLVHFDIQFSISSWAAKVPRPSNYTKAGVNPGKLYFYTSLLNYGNVSTSQVNPFANLRVGGEPNRIYVRGLPDHYPALFNGITATNFSVNVTTDLPGSPGLRGNPFFYSWGGTGTGGTNGTVSTSGTGTNAVMWLALEPASVHARITKYQVSATTFPQIELFGYRRAPYRGTGSLLGFASTSQIPTDAIAPVQSHITIWDFLSPWRTDSTKVFVTISGSYITNHQTVEQADEIFNPFEPEDADPGIDPQQ
jgi:hypothetical protein